MSLKMFFPNSQTSFIKKVSSITHFAESKGLGLTLSNEMRDQVYISSYE